MRSSLIVPTVGRTTELERLLVSLSVQTYQDFELLVVDQNPDDRLVPILASHTNTFPVIHLRSDKGQSRARNVGLRHAKGDIVAFPDDDCQYPPNLLDRVVQFFIHNPEVDGLTGRSIDEDGKPSNGRFDITRGNIDKFNVWTRGISYSIFLRRGSVQALWFDEDLGPGAGTKWGAGDETEYLLQLLKQGLLLYYDPTLVVFHPSPITEYGDRAVHRAYTYGSGMGRVLRVHRYPLWFVSYQWVRPLAGLLLSFGQGRTAKARYHWAVFLGRLAGWITGLEGQMRS
jgi:glycosyltransferase involved in cell wall biosynthesis